MTAFDSLSASVPHVVDADESQCHRLACKPVSFDEVIGPGNRAFPDVLAIDPAPRLQDSADFFVAWTDLPSASGLVAILTAVA